VKWVVIGGGRRLPFCHYRGRRLSHWEGNLEEEEEVVVVVVVVVVVG